MCTRVQFHLRHSAKRNSGGVPGQRHRHHWHGDNTRREGSTSGVPVWMPSSLPALKPGAIAVHSFGPRRIHLPAPFARPSDRRHGRCAGDRRGRHRGCARRSRRSGSWDGGRPNGNGIPGVRGIRRQPPSSPSFAGKNAGHTALTKGFTGRLARGIHNRLTGGVEPAGDGDIALSTATRLVRNLAIPAEAAGRSDLLPCGPGKAANLSSAPTYRLS